MRTGRCQRQRGAKNRTSRWPRKTRDAIKQNTSGEGKEDEWMTVQKKKGITGGKRKHARRGRAGQEVRDETEWQQGGRGEEDQERIKKKKKKQDKRFLGRKREKERKRRVSDSFVLVSQKLLSGDQEDNRELPRSAHIHEKTHTQSMHRQLYTAPSQHTHTHTHSWIHTPILPSIYKKVQHSHARTRLAFCSKVSARTSQIFNIQTKYF